MTTNTQKSIEKFKEDKRKEWLMSGDDRMINYDLKDINDVISLIDEAYNRGFHAGAIADWGDPNDN